MTAIKTFAGLSKTRTGSLPVGIKKLIERSHASGFADRIKEAVSEDDALDAAKLLSQKGRTQRYIEGGAIGGATYPLVSAAGEAAKGFVAHSGKGKIRAAMHAAKTMMKAPEVAKNVTRGVMGGGVIQGVREGVELGKARSTVDGFLKERRGE